MATCPLIATRLEHCMLVQTIPSALQVTSSCVKCVGQRTGYFGWRGRDTGVGGGS